MKGLFQRLKDSAKKENAVALQQMEQSVHELIRSAQQEEKMLDGGSAQLPDSLMTPFEILNDQSDVMQVEPETTNGEAEEVMQRGEKTTRDGATPWAKHLTRRRSLETQDGRTPSPRVGGTGRKATADARSKGKRPAPEELSGETSFHFNDPRSCSEDRRGGTTRSPSDSRMRLRRRGGADTEPYVPPPLPQAAETFMKSREAGI